MHRSMLVTGQLDLSLEEVLGTLAAPSAAELLRSSLADAVGVGGPAVVFSVSEPERIAANSGRVKVRWRSDDRQSAPPDGEVSVYVFALRSGSEPLTELAVTMNVDDVRATRAAATMHRVLDAVAERLER